MMRKPVRLIGVVLLAALVGGIGWVLVHRNQENPEQLLLYGNVDIRQIRLAFHASGRITALLVQEGERVHKGQLLAEIEAARYQATVKRLEGEVRAQAEVLARLKAGSRPQEIAQARARVRAAEVRARDAELRYNRLEKLARKQYVSRQRRDDAEAERDATRAELAAARQTLALAVAGPRKEEIREAAAALAARKGGLSLARQELADTKLYAPAAGVVQERVLEPGDMASPAIPVLVLAKDQPLWVRAYVPETELGKLRPGMRAVISTDSFPGKRYPGWVGFISPTAEFTPKNVETATLRTRLVYQARIFVCEPKGELRLGMPATVSIRLDQPAVQSPFSRDQVCAGEGA